MPRRLEVLITVSWILLVGGAGALAQQSPGYFAPSFSSPTLTVGAGVWYCNSAPAYVPKAMITASGTLYVFLQSSLSCTSFQTNTTGFPPVGAVPIATVISGVLTDARAWVPPWLPVLDASSFPGTDAAAKINACIGALPLTGGTCDARGLTGAQTIGSTITFNAPAVLLLGTATFTPTVLPAFTINSNNVAISGSHFGVTTINIPDLSYGADLFSFGNGVAAFKINDLTIGIVSGGLTSARTGSVFNLSTAAGGGMIFKNLRFSGDSTLSAGNIFNDYRALSGGGGGQYEISDVLVGNEWERFIYLGAPQKTCGDNGTSWCTTGSIHISRLLTLYGVQFHTAEFDLDGGTDTFDVDNSELGNSIYPGTEAIYLHNSTSNPIDPRLVTLDHVFIQNSGNSGNVGTLVRLDAARSFRIMNSYLTGAVYGVTVAAWARDTNISGNSFSEMNYSAIVVSSGSIKTSIQNNHFEDTDTDPNDPNPSVIYLTGGTNDVQIIGNRLANYAATRIPVNFVSTAPNASEGFLVVTGNDFGTQGANPPATYSGTAAINLNGDTSPLYTIADNTPFEAFHLVAGGSDNQFHFWQMIGGNPVENWKIDTSGNLLAPGSASLGIGTTGPVSALNVAGTTGVTWTSGGNNLGLATFGTPATGGSLYVNTPSLNSSFQSGLGIDGTYGTPSYQSVINIRALGVHSGGGYGSQLAFWTTNETALNQQMTIDKAGNVGIGTTTPAAQLQVANAMVAGIVPKSGTTSWSIDLSTGNVQQFVCTGNGTIVSPSITYAGSSTLVKGEIVTLIFVQTASPNTACTVTWPSNIHGAMPSSFLSTLGSVNAQRFVVSNNGSDLYATGPGSVSMTGGTP